MSDTDSSASPAAAAAAAPLLADTDKYERISSSWATAAVLAILVLGGLCLGFVAYDIVSRRKRLASMQQTVVVAATQTGLPVPAALAQQYTDLPNSVSPKGLAAQLLQLSAIAGQVGALAGTAQRMSNAATQAGAELQFAQTNTPGCLYIGNGWRLVTSAGRAELQADTVTHTAFSQYQPEVSVSNPNNGLVSVYMLQLSRSMGSKGGSFPDVYAAGDGSHGIPLNINDGATTPTQWSDQNAWLTYTQDSVGNGQYMHQPLPSTSS
jgi:hypothetical protein